MFSTSPDGKHDLVEPLVLSERNPGGARRYDQVWTTRIFGFTIVGFVFAAQLFSAAREHSSLQHTIAFACWCLFAISTYAIADLAKWREQHKLLGRVSVGVLLFPPVWAVPVDPFDKNYTQYLAILSTTQLCAAMFYGFRMRQERERWGQSSVAGDGLLDLAGEISSEASEASFSSEPVSEASSLGNVHGVGRSMLDRSPMGGMRVLEKGGPPVGLSSGKGPPTIGGRPLTRLSPGAPNTTESFLRKTQYELTKKKHRTLALVGTIWASDPGLRRMVLMLLLALRGGPTSGSPEEGPVFTRVGQVWVNVGEFWILGVREFFFGEDCCSEGAGTNWIVVANMSLMTLFVYANSIAIFFEKKSQFPEGTEHVDSPPTEVSGSSGTPGRTFPLELCFKYIFTALVVHAAGVFIFGRSWRSKS